MALKCKVAILSVALATVLATSTAQADIYNQGSGFYVEPAVGGWVDASNAYDSSPVGSVSVGYKINHQFAVQVAPYAGATANAVVGEGIWNIPTKSRWNPYVAIGAGYMHMVHSGFGMDAGVGVRYQVSQNLDLTLNYRYMQLFDDDWNNGNVITAGIRVFFGQADQSPAMDDQVVKEQYVLPEGVERCSGDMSQATKQSTGCYSVSSDEVTMHLDVKFAFDRSVLTPGSKVAVTRLATFMKQYPATNVVLYGYASWEGKGSKSYNKKLSLKRANAVRVYLRDLGIDNTRIKTVGMGITSPIASNKTEAGRALNRRVEAAIGLPLKQAK
ncbi:OmpA family protein [Thiotrichales bacterium 19S3-7]|nr:OmpA family protein [Thiotrichales bacterium 19S3-7]MCF6800974.1 OmpA family protein [Thiotrichales bacterium 19S3-11]